MAYPAAAKTLQKWVVEIDEKLLSLKATAQHQKQIAQAGSLSMDYVQRFFDMLVSANVFLLSAAAVTGLPAYINTEKGNATADPVADITACRNSIVATLTWLRANVPTGTFGSLTYRLAYIFPADNQTAASMLTFTASQAAGYVTALDSLIATIG